MSVPIERVLGAALAALGCFVALQIVRAPAAGPRTAADDRVRTAPALIRAPTRGDVQETLAFASEPPPPHDTAAVRRRLTSESAGTYLAEILTQQDSLLARWPDRTRPLRVWVSPRSDAPDWHPDFASAATDAVVTWSTVGIPLGLVFTGDSASADVPISWSDRLDQDRIGVTWRLTDQYGRIVQARIAIAVHGRDGRALTPSLVHAAALHEIGHALGLGHTADTTAIMTTHAHDATRTLSTADRATLRLLYGLPSGSVRE